MVTMDLVLVLPCVLAATAACAALRPNADFDDRLGRHFDRKIKRMSMA
jgi:hypothetical protein